MKIYFAGPDVFRPDAIAHGEAIAAAAREVGIDALYPLDNKIVGEDRRWVSEAIFEANCNMLRRAGAVIANLNAFRGPEPDSGTCFEVGMAFALGTPVIAYCDDGAGEYRDRIHGVRDGLDPVGFVVENFGLPVNLMLAYASCAIVQGDVFLAIRVAAERFGLIEQDAAPTSESAGRLREVA